MMEEKIEEFIDFLRQEERSENTIDTYVHSVRKYFEMFDEITKKNMIEYKKHMISDYAPKTATRGIASRIHKMTKYGFRPEILHPHAFRHLYAIEFLKRNGDITLLSSLMGHESIDTTAIYLRRSAEEQKRSLDAAMNW